MALGFPQRQVLHFYSIICFIERATSLLSKSGTLCLSLKKTLWTTDYIFSACDPEQPRGLLGKLAKVHSGFIKHIWSNSSTISVVSKRLPFKTQALPNFQPAQQRSLPWFYTCLPSLKSRTNQPCVSIGSPPYLSEFLRPISLGVGCVEPR